MRFYRYRYNYHGCSDKLNDNRSSRMQIVKILSRIKDKSIYLTSVTTFEIISVQEVMRDENECNTIVVTFDRFFLIR